jgi:t-SNARE complex subunit (syntaxin)
MPGEAAAAAALRRRSEASAANRSLSTLQPAAAEISALMGQLAAEVASQHDAVASIEAAAVASRENVRKGNRELQKAASRPSALRDLVLLLLGALALVLLFLEWYTP